MEEQEKNYSKQRETAPQRQLRGLYAKVNISVKSLNIIILVLAAAIVVCMVIGVSNAGFIVQFDTLGGTAVESQKHMYGEVIESPEPPSREGYVFDGWYLDQDATRPWDVDNDIVTESMTLYAGWRLR
ncbi:MAG: InlB B-repeat-containing protein [Lachnospiraceae bacterium]|nr:InlB B-repeat-containing protein [Lachnospiraceae bacterium]MDE6622569.1 InlB B-repeat-containing protein [Lachnospiraceae bacterium]